MSAEATKNVESQRVPIRSNPLLGDFPAAELREIIETAVREAEDNVRHYLTSDHEHGNITRLAKWRKRLKARTKVKAWLDSISPNTDISGREAAQPKEKNAE